jgi:hypothetical protein
MNLNDPRVSKTGQLLTVALVGFWIGKFSAEVSHSATSWVTFALSIFALFGSLYLLLREVWEPRRRSGTGVR